MENTKKLANGNSTLSETIEKGSDWYKTWLETQKNLFTKATSEAPKAAEAVKETIKDNTAKASEFFENWMKTQADLAKQMWDMSQEAAKNMGNGTNTNPFAQWQNSFNTASNPMASWMNNNSSNPMTAWMNQMQANNWMNQMQQMNPFNADNMKKAQEQMTSAFGQFNTTLQGTMGDWTKMFQSNTAHDAYNNMMKSGEGFAKFAEIWAPMFKSMQEKTFNMDEYKKWMNPATYKEFTDKFFSFMPQEGREFMTQMADKMKEGAAQMSQAGMNSYNQLRGMMGNGADVFGNVNKAYSSFTSMMNEAASPFSKLMPENAQSKTIKEWSDISKRIAEYNIKNAELQYMIYSQGTKVMDKLAESTAKKIQDGVEVKSMLGLYQEWMNISDKVYVSLFESTEYSKLMGEVSSMQNKLRKDIELQVEGMMKDIPVATRSQMDEVYKTIYDLKKKVREMAAKMTVAADSVVEDEAVAEDEFDEEEEYTAPSPAKKAVKKATAPAKRGRK